MTSQPREYIETAQRYDSTSPMWNTAVAVCRMRELDPFEHRWFEGEWMPRWQLVIIEGMMLHSIAEETARRGKTSVCFPYGGPEPGQRNADDMGMPPR